MQCREAGCCIDEKTETIDKDGKEVNALEAMTNQSLRLTVKNSSNLQNYDTREYTYLNMERRIEIQ
jgi:hypothetical protein